MEYIYEGKKFSAKVLETITHSFINIDSKREIIRTNRNDFAFYVIRDPNRNPVVAYICGKPESIKKFFSENKIDKAELFNTTPEVAVTASSTSAITSIASSDSSSSKNSIFTPKSKNVRDLPAEVLKRLCPFNLNGLLGISGEGRIISVIDGDTITMVLYLDLHGLSIGRQVTYERKKQIMAPALCENKDTGFFTAFRCRLYGIDSAEKNTEEGQLAKKIMMDKYTSLHGYVFYKIRSFDKYGRALVDLYEDSSYTRYINDLLLGYPDSRHRILATPYFGGTKSELMTNLPTITTHRLKTARQDTAAKKADSESKEEKESSSDADSSGTESASGKESLIEESSGKDKVPDDDSGDYLSLD